MYLTYMDTLQEGCNVGLCIHLINADFSLISVPLFFPLNFKFVLVCWEDCRELPDMFIGIYQKESK